MNTESKSIIDIHTHMLPLMDDGAKDAEESARLLKTQAKNGVGKVFLTSHFRIQKEDVEAYLFRRETAERTLLDVYDDKTMPAYQLGAEVAYSPALDVQELKRLTLGGGMYLLLELPTTRYPEYVENVVRDLDMIGIVPILAHVERCGYFHDQPELLLRLSEMGALAQVSAECLYGAWDDDGFSKACLTHSLAQIIASDTHNESKRPPDLHLAKAAVPEELWEQHERFSACVWENRFYPRFYQTPVKKGFFKFK